MCLNYSGLIAYLSMSLSFHSHQKTLDKMQRSLYIPTAVPSSYAPIEWAVFAMMISTAGGRALMLDCTVCVCRLVPPLAVKIYNLCDIKNHAVHKAYFTFSVSSVNSVLDDAVIPVLTKIRIMHLQDGPQIHKILPCRIHKFQQPAT